MSVLASIEIQRPASVRQQLTDVVRTKILSQALRAGEKLPSTHELARMWSTDVKTAHRALTPLVKEGLLQRAPRVGTFVRNREKRLTRVGIYLTQAALGAPGFPLARAVLTELQTLLNAEGIQPDVWVDPRPGKGSHQPWPELERAAQQRRLQAIILVESSLEVLQWVKKLPVPFTFLGNAGLANEVSGDMEQMAELAMAGLKRSGCRSAGLLCGFQPDQLNPNGTLHNYTKFFRAWAAAAQRAGVTVREEWTPVSREPMEGGWAQFEKYGYDWFGGIWEQAERPEGVAVMDDAMAQGVIKAALERQVRVPEQMRLLALKNAHVDLFTPVPVTPLVLNETDIAQGLLTQVQKQFRGESCVPINVSFQLMTDAKTVLS